MNAFVDGLATTLLTYGIHSAAACALALFLGRVLRRPEDRDLLWKTTLVAPLITASIAIAFTTIGTDGAFVDLGDVVRHTPNIEFPGRAMKVRILYDGTRSEVVRELADPVTTVLSSSAIVVALYLASLSLFRFVHRRRALARAVSNRRTVGELCIVGHRNEIRLSVATGLQSPVALGVNEICLPTEVVDDFSEAHRRSLIAHEAAHLERRDPAWFFAAELIAGLSAFQPLIFIVVRAFRRDVELICDEVAVRRTNDQHSLIGALALLASPFDPRSPLHGAATAYDGSPLVARAQRIATLSLSAAAPHSRRQVLFLTVALFALLCGAPVVSAAPRWSDFPLDPADAVHEGARRHRVVTVDQTFIHEKTQQKIVILR